MADGGARVVTDDRCRNCGTALTGRWCHACGQDSRDPLRDFGALSAEFLDTVVGWDSRLIRSLRLLLSAPGALTDEFVAGRRARYLGPLRLYLIASIAFFACYTLTPDPVLATIAGSGDWRLGLQRIDYIARWLPSLMILILPGFALIIQLLFRSPPRAFLEHLVFVLHFGAFSFLLLPAAQLVAVGLRAIGAITVDNWPLLVAHLANATYFYLATRRHYGLGAGATFARMLAFCALLTLLLGGVAALAQHLIERF
jgi:hypothetical protein